MFLDTNYVSKRNNLFNYMLSDIISKMVGRYFTLAILKPEV